MDDQFENVFEEHTRPISCSDSPAFQRRQISVFCAGERPYRLPGLMNNTSKTTTLYQMVLHPPVELAPFLRNSGFSAHFMRR